MLRPGIVRACGFGLSLCRLVSDLLRVAYQPPFAAGLALYATSTLVWFRPHEGPAYRGSVVREPDLRADDTGGHGDLLRTSLVAGIGLMECAEG